VHTDSRLLCLEDIFSQSPSLVKNAVDGAYWHVDDKVTSYLAKAFHLPVNFLSCYLSPPIIGGTINLKLSVTLPMDR
jgi:hypothetical protein